MRRTARMHVNPRASLSESPRRAGMIKMNVAQENVTHVLRVESNLAKIDNYVVEGRFRPGIEECDPIVGFERGRGDDSGKAKLLRIQNVDLHFLLAATMYAPFGIAKPFPFAYCCTDSSIAA